MMEYPKKIYRFTWSDGSVTYSRHKQPDFAYDMTEEQIIKVFNREEVTDEEEIKRNMLG